MKVVLVKRIALIVLFSLNIALLSTANYLRYDFEGENIHEFDIILTTRMRFNGWFWYELCSPPPYPFCAPINYSHVSAFGSFNAGIYILLGLSIVSTLIGIAFTYHPKFYSLIHRFELEERFGFKTMTMISGITTIIGAIYGFISIFLFIRLRNSIIHPYHDYLSSIPVMQFSAAFYFTVMIFTSMLLIGIHTLYRIYKPKIVKDKQSERASQRLSDIIQKQQ
ncbi:MAG: hypothetical protein FK730_17110 [Asgard group archaeon]|nr:hypothetical protein [Asgard group archaeon]